MSSLILRCESNKSSAVELFPLIKFRYKIWFEIVCNAGNLCGILRDLLNACVIRDFSCDKNVKILNKICIAQILLYWGEWGFSLIKFSDNFFGFINECGQSSSQTPGWEETYYLLRKKHKIFVVCCIIEFVLSSKAYSSINTSRASNKYKI